MIEDVAQQQHSMIEAFTADPGALADPWHYVQAPSDLLPVPAIRLELVGHGVDVSSVGPARVITRAEVGGEVYAGSIAFPLHPDQAGWERLDRALKFEELSEWCDLAFYRHAVPDHVMRSARRGIQGIANKRVLQIV